MSDAASSDPKAFFTADHHTCDELWSKVEQAVDEGKQDEARALWQEFEKSIRRHFAMEEEQLFPAIEDAMNMHGGGPTEVMRMEHRQMRAVLDQMAESVAAGDLQGMADHGDTLLMLTQQHNVKEEGILYPMASQSLGAQWQELAARLGSY